MKFTHLFIILLMCLFIIISSDVHMYNNVLLRVLNITDSREFAAFVSIAD